MLKHLTINNYVLIEALDIDFQSGFSVLTGETGAGKSIILGALSLLMGQRADVQSIMPGAAKCMVEGIFDIEANGMQALFDELDLDYEPSECILRREVSATGKSRAFVCDSPVSLSVLRKIALQLLDIHSQHSNLLLENAGFQLGVVDTISNQGELLRQYQTCYERVIEARRQLHQAETLLANQQADEDYMRFQLTQIESFNPQPGEDDALRQQQNELSHAEEIRMSLSAVNGLLCGDGDGESGAGVMDSLQRALQTMRQVARIYPSIEDYEQRMESVLIEVKDISADIGRFADDVECSPERLQQVTERLDTLFTLERKFHLNSAEELLSHADDLRSRLDALTDSADVIAKLKRQMADDTAEADRLAAKLSAVRAKAALEVERRVSETLSSMEMPSAQFSAHITQTDDLQPTGKDVVTFLFSSNKGLTPRPLADVASGGEMARVMLALKAMTSSQIHLPTIIFDEIDTGVSGKVASSMAEIMSVMSRAAGQQVIAITHLPQIAAKGSVHYQVYKEETDKGTRSHIRMLDAEQRVDQLALMLSGTTVTEAARENARQLLSGNGN